MAALDWAQVVLGGVLAIAGLVVVRSSRTRDGALVPKPLPFGTWSPSVPTRYVLGISLLLLAYHLAAYGFPVNWVPLRVPVDRFWMLAVALAGACAVSIVVDILEGTEPPEEPSG